MWSHSTNDFNRNKKFYSKAIVYRNSWLVQLKARNSISFFRFYGAINDLIKDKSGNVNERIRYCFDNHPSVKDAIESLGPPHTEVTAILVNSNPQSFDYLLQDQDDIEVYSSDIELSFASQLLLPNKPKGEPKFILDVHLGGLARYLRFSGLDTLYDNADPGDNALANISYQGSRVLLTRDIGLLKHANIRYGHWLRNTQPEKQFLEVAVRYDLNHFLKLFSRCSICNGTIVKIEKSPLKDRLSLSLYSQFDDFWGCKSCHQIYWKGKHYYSIKKQLDALVKQLNG